MKRELFIGLLFMASHAWLGAQDFSGQRVSLSLRDTPLEHALYMLIDQHSIPLSFSNSLLPEKRVTAEIKGRPLNDVLDFLLDGTTIAYRQVGRQIVLFSRAYPVPAAVDYITLSGYVRDASTGEPLLTAAVFDRLSGQGTHSNAYGFFTLRLPRGEADLQCSYLGYTPRSLVIDLSEDHRLDIELETSLTLQEVVVTAEDRLSPYARSGYAVNTLSPSDAEHLPTLGGEPDVVRTAMLLPGVQTGADGFGGLYVRGGDVEQNLILLDGVPVYNLSHAAGLFSIFNSASIKTATLSRGNAPARYGGRLSSVLDVRTRDGNNQSFAGRLDMGLVSARALLEGPIVKGKSSFLVAARKSFLNWYLRPISRSVKARNGEWGATSYGFYDLNAKVNYHVSEKDKLYLSLYAGDDDFTNVGGYDQHFVGAGIDKPRMEVFRYEQLNEERLRWGNTVGSLRWNHVFNPKLFSTLAVHYSRFQVRAGYEVSDSLYSDQPHQELVGSTFNLGRYRSGIEDLGLRADLEYRPTNGHVLRFGASLNRQQYEPGVLQYDEATAELVPDEPMPMSRLSALEGGLYAEGNFDLGERWQLNAGLRGSFLHAEGSTFLRLEPRLAARFMAGPHTSLHASFGVQTQAVHLLTSSNLGLPIDLWVPSMADVPPELARQWSLGIDQKMPLGLQLRLEGYYKLMDNLVAYADGAFFIDNWRENVTTGKGKSYGLEVMVERRRGKLRGWVAYTLARTDRQFEEVNFGRPYPFRYDRRHDLKVALRYRLSERLEFSADWIFGTGLAYSLPEYKLTYDYPGVPDQPLDLYVFSEKNQNRLPANHRLDLGVNLQIPTGQRFKHQLSGGVYNLYNRQNPLFYDLRSRMEVRNGSLQEGKQLVQVTLAPILPYLSYSIEF